MRLRVTIYLPDANEGDDGEDARAYAGEIAAEALENAAKACRSTSGLVLGDAWNLTNGANHPIAPGVDIGFADVVEDPESTGPVTATTNTADDGGAR